EPAPWHLLVDLAPIRAAAFPHQPEEVLLLVIRDTGFVRRDVGDRDELGRGSWNTTAGELFTVASGAPGREISPVVQSYASGRRNRPLVAMIDQFGRHERADLTGRYEHAAERTHPVLFLFTFDWRQRS